MLADILELVYKIICIHITIIEIFGPFHTDIILTLNGTLSLQANSNRLHMYHASFSLVSHTKSRAVENAKRKTNQVQKPAAHNATLIDFVQKGWSKRPLRLPLALKGQASPPVNKSNWSLISSTRHRARSPICDPQTAQFAGSDVAIIEIIRRSGTWRESRVVPVPAVGRGREGRGIFR